LLAGAPCPHFSHARGGKPMSRRERSTPRQILKWLKDLEVDAGLVENISEFTGWGPLNNKGYPIKRRKGEYYEQFTNRIVDLGYDLETRILNAADYGAATTRKRLFMMFRKHGKIRWPETTHTEETWRGAREIIDWSIEGESIFTRKKPLADKTIARIAAGIKKFCGEWAQPFLVLLYGTGGVRSVDRPAPTITSGGGRGGGHIALCEFILQQQSGGVPRDVSKPAPAIAARGAQSLVKACLVPFYGERKGQDPRTHSIDKPVPTIPASGDGKFGKVDFIVQVNHGGGNGGRLNDVDEPMRTISTKNGFGLVENFVVKYFGTGVPHSVDEPVPTVTTKDRIGLVQCGTTTYGLDIRFRMLQPHELSAAMSFPKAYKFEGNRGDLVRQIGNAWDCLVGKALCKSLLS
jgi:DNA (cytosine-5)-methyltransferase 1